MNNTDLPEEIPARYNPKATEDKWYKVWEENNLFAGKPDPQKKPFCIVIPPPNVTGILHMGHALNNTVQDILIRYHRMKGDAALWMPGTDHAGIATQNVVEKSIAKEGLKRQDLGRQKFIERVWAWKEQYGSTIIRQLKKLGASCDWSRTRFTMDSGYSRAVNEVFVTLWNKGLIYQDNKVINWCPRCQTALSDEEAPHKTLKGNLYYIKYPLKKSTVDSQQSTEKTKSNDYITVATTRPETMLGDTAVAVNPKDKRYKKILGKRLILPLVNRELEIIADDSVDKKFGTGAVKVTPAHDPNDYIMGKKHKLEFINVMHPNAEMNDLAGNYRGMDRFEARDAIIEDLKDLGLLEKIEPHELSAGHCYRCHTVIEPYLSRQWFVKMKPLAKPAIAAVKKGEIKFYPKRWTKVYLNWMENIQDWCISRQIWWGHRLPIYYCKKCQASEDRRQKTEDRGFSQGVFVSREPFEKCPKCGSRDIYQDEDVLDTWFSSWLWPFATFGWPFERQRTEDRGQRTENTDAGKRDLEYFYPTQVLVTAPEIIFFWVARMIMAGFEFMGEKPFSDVYIHGTVRDIEGKKMSKSLGNVIDPLDIIGEYGADALRFSLISITAQGQDVYLSKEKFEQGRNFANKIWNASRFIMMNLEPANVKADLCVYFKKEDIGIINRWILSSFYSTLNEVDKLLDSFRFNEAANVLYAFFWHEFCDWYLELIKTDIKNPHNQLVMYKVLEKYLRLIHPFMPFISSEIWQRLGELAVIKRTPKETIMSEPWPHMQKDLLDKKVEQRMRQVFEVIAAMRNMRQELDIPLQKEVSLIVSSVDRNLRELIAGLSPQIKSLARLSALEIRPVYSVTRSSSTQIIGDIHITLPLEGIIDIDKEKSKITERIRAIETQIAAKKKILSNQDFLKKAPQDIVEAEKNRIKDLSSCLERLKTINSGIS